ncbi:hypothetical protein NM74_19465 [Aeromonas hydrophila]|nr:hypothetical protein NM74_19465 [Aeromonas hydrophila]
MISIDYVNDSVGVRDTALTVVVRVALVSYRLELAKQIALKLAHHALCGQIVGEISPLKIQTRVMVFLVYGGIEGVAYPAD